MTRLTDNEKFMVGYSDMKAIVDAMPDNMKGNAPGMPAKDGAYVEGWAAALLEKAIIFWVISGTLRDVDCSEDRFIELVHTVWRDLNSETLQ